jgi:hypothetical protein
MAQRHPSRGTLASMDRRLLALGLLALAGCTAPQPCPSPLHECDGQCVDIESDRRHCGGCGVACATGKACIARACISDPGGPCPLRTGGAFVTLGQCGTAVKTWVQSDEVIDWAIGRVGQVPDPAFVPSLAVLAKPDCDAQWSWHVDATRATLAPFDPAEACTSCPQEIQPADPNGMPRTARWCPADARVLAVDDKRP